jgi:LacI family transcriptional regulator
LSASRTIYSTPKEDVLKNIQPKLATWIDNGEHPTAVIAVEDTTAVYTINVARELGIDVPSQLRVVGFDNLGIARLFEPAFTTTAPDFIQLGSTAMEHMLDMDASEKCTYIHTLSVPIKRR